MIFNSAERQVIIKDKPETIDENMIIVKYHSSVIFNELIKILKIRKMINWLANQL